MFLLGLCCVLQPFLCVALLLPHQWATKSAADTQTPLDTRGSAKDPLLRGRGGSRRETAAAVSRAPLLGLLSGLCTRACESGAAETAGSPTKLKIPKNTIGLGTCCVTGKECYDRVLEGLALGYRVIDTATHYENEAEVGEALDEGLRRGYLKAEEAFVISKGSLELHPYLQEEELVKLYRDKGIRVVLKWHLQKGFLPIAASKSRDRLRENLAISKAASQGRAEIEFDVKDMNILASMEKNARCGFDPNLIA
uniref:NADP-dependent oxidoreductase domain-containing protein n=1 Tax=Chromera velia CCMP2878 TaxID=1169474 RepID=A0A0G4G3X9_9ALVE|eukprot:Cvel_20089.t1-p1 / transcript=Cvel_20089.t1 / gene=Cvel_20089 / organism=Chromera_velia_CCMP2878 / gene_product=NADPH-dependent D-xylose reductase, putative / transcript_product=NADPH-dependent D-xylose reductase, putative / location=Cvel_scaffold1778:30503-34366(+) / protein_length=252 / sequence_SO=supercontig / SO=protein_coding / is_pseudo=false